MMKGALWMDWSNKVDDTVFIHNFFMDEVLIYNQLLSKKPEKLAGRLKDLANSFNVGKESFFGFLLGIEPLVKHDLRTLNHRNRIKIEIDLPMLHQHLRQKPCFEHLLDLDGWEGVAEKTDDCGVAEPITKSASKKAVTVGNSIPGKGKTLWDVWRNKVLDIDFVHEYFMDELVIYHWILSQKKMILDGSVFDLAKYFDVREEVFFGFLMSIAPLLGFDRQNMKNSDPIDIKIGLYELREYLMTKPDCTHLLTLEGWKDALDISRELENDPDISKQSERSVDKDDSEPKSVTKSGDAAAISGAIICTDDRLSDLDVSVTSDNTPHLNALKEHIFSEPVLSCLNAKLASEYTRSDFIVFLSLCNATKRATVVKGIGHDLKAAWAKAEKNARNLIAIAKFNLAWAKADIVCSTAEINTEELNREMVDSSFPFFLRKGVAFDRDFDVAFLEGEMNGSRLYHYYSMEQYQNKEIDHNSQRLNLSAINDYLTNSYPASEPIKNLPKVITAFTTIGFFCDNEENVYDLYGGCGIDAGRRAIIETDADLAIKMMTSVSKSLAGKIGQDGNILYSYNPVTAAKAYNNNILRHADSVLSLIRAYQITRNESIIGSIEAGVEHLLNSSIVYKKPDVAFVLDKKADEIKLGGNGLAVTMLIEYMDCFETDCFIEVARCLANGILELQDKITGTYYHVLNSHDFSLKEKIRTIYYDGSATYALTRMYTFTKERKYLDAAASSVDSFIARKYSKYMDHQIAYSLNEITKYISKPQYYEFALQNAVENLDEIVRRPRVHITFLPLLLAVWQTYERLRIRGIRVEYINESDVGRIAEAIYKMATHLLNAYFYPEYAMYMKAPENSAGSVFRREGSFQEKIDDAQFFIEGFSMYREHYDSIRSYLSEDFIRSVHRNNLVIYQGVALREYPEEASESSQAIAAKEIVLGDHEISLNETNSKMSNNGLTPIGFLYDSKFAHPERSFFEANGYFKTLFHIAPHYGLNLVLFSPRDVDFEANTVQGTVLVNGEPEKCTAEIPGVIDNPLRVNNRYSGFENKIEAFAYMIRKSGSNKKRKKHDIYNMLLLDGKYKNLLIPTLPLKSFADITSMVSEAGIVIKKTDSHQGKSVLHISRVDSNYRLVIAQNCYDFTESKLREYYEQYLRGKKYILQPFIKSVSRYGEPFDVRLQARRIDDERFFVNPYVRIGSPQGIISNFAGGGYTLALDAFLRSNFDQEEQMDINNQITRLGDEFPEYYSRLLGDARIFDLGIDLGITKKGNSFKLWLFEVNTYIGGHIYGLGDARAHCEYLRHITDKLSVG